jgi:replicative DNA helicase
VNIDPEVTLLTSLFCEPAGIVEVAAMVRPEDFRGDDSRRAYRSMLALSERGIPIDSISVVAELKSGGIAETQAIDLVDRATDGCPLPGHARRYAGLIRKAAKKRGMAALMEQSRLRAEQGEDPAEIMRDTLGAILDLQDDRPEKAILPVSSFALEVLNESAALRSGAEKELGVQTGIDGLDLTTRGIYKSEFWVIGAMPGRGKTALGTQIAMHACTSGMPVLFFSLEMTAGQLFRRILGMEFGASLVRNPRALSAQRWTELTEYAGQLSGLPLYIEDSSSMPASELSLKARLAIRQHGIKLVVVDYLQLLRGTGNELRERVSNAANTLRQLAKDTGVPVVALSQLRRPGNLNDVPSMIDLKESGDIEAHANTVVLIYMPQGEDRQPTGEDELIIGKQRNGPIGSVPVSFDKKRLMFQDREVGGAA